MYKSTKRIMASASASIIVLYLSLFGVGFFTNVHSAYLRVLSRWTVLVHNTAGAGGTGFIATGKSGKKYVITNGHVCGLAEDGKIFAIYKGDEYRLKVVKQYQWNDLCAIEAPSSAGLSVNIASSFEEGESAYAIGHPLLEPRSITLGELSGPVVLSIPTAQNVLKESCKGPTYELIEMDPNSFFFLLGIQNLCIRTLEAEAATVPILPGNSGSAVVNIYGSVIGVAFAATETGTRSYVVPLRYVKDFLESL